MVTVYRSHADDRVSYLSCDMHDHMVPGEVWCKGRIDAACQFCAKAEFDRAVKLFRKVPSATNYLTLQTAMLQYQDATMNHRED